MLTMRVEAEKVSDNVLVSDNPDVGFIIANESGAADA
jgi:minor fimbrial subunit